jgi:catechol 2,3-dioxygenase-like lactoylglutathione lyase family enzyme
MSAALDHIIIPAKDRWAAARFLAGILGVEVGAEWGHFVPVRIANGVTLDFADAKDVRAQHCAFLVGEAEFDAALARLRRADIAFFADFDGSGSGEINHLYGGRGVYFRDPNGHLVELITRPYGESPERWTATKSA